MVSDVRQAPSAFVMKPNPTANTTQHPISCIIICILARRRLAKPVVHRGRRLWQFRRPFASVTAFIFVLAGVKGGLESRTTTTMSCCDAIRMGARKGRKALPERS